MAIVPYTKKMLLQRIQKHMANGFPNDAFATSQKEIILYIDQAISFLIVGKAYEIAKIEGSLEVPEAFLVTFNLGSPTQDSVTGNWSSVLPQTPLSLPIGYSITHVYFANSSEGQSLDVFPIKNKRLGFRNYMPKPTGCFYWVENNTLWLAANNGQPLSQQTLYVQMPVSRTEDMNDNMAIPDDIIQPVFDTVVKELTNRYMMPKDVVNDDLPAGSNNLKQ